MEQYIERPQEDNEKSADKNHPERERKNAAGLICEERMSVQRERQGYMHARAEDMALVTVIVPVYNVENYLERCLDSILGQTWPNLEVLLMDDGSTDRSGEICDAYSRRDARVHVTHLSHGGQSRARNTGLDMASGAYICFVDSDDWLEAGILEKTLKEIRDGDVCVFGFNDILRDRITHRHCTPCVLDRRMTLERLINDNGTMNYVIWNKLYRAEVLKDVRFDDAALIDDFYFTPKALYNSRKTILIDEIGYNHSVDRPGSITESSPSETWMISVEALFANAVFFRDKGAEEPARASADRAFKLCIHHYGQYIERNEHENVRKCYELFRKSKKGYSSFLRKTDPIRLVNNAFVICPRGVSALQRRRRSRKEKRTR